MKRVLKFLRQYKLFCLAILTILVGLILEFTGQRTAAHWLLGLVAITALFPLLWSLWQDFRSGKYGLDILAGTAIVTALILGQFWVAIVVVLMLAGSEVLEDFARLRANSELDTLLSHAPKQTHRLHKGKLSNVSVDELKVGEKILIMTGETVPTDAIILDGTSNFDEALLTGESSPQPRTTGDRLLSGSINLGVSINAKVTASARDSQYQQLIRLVKGTANSQSPFVRLADSYVLPFTFLAYGLATAAWLFSGHAIRFLEVIVVATPYPLIFAVPIALTCGMSRASRFGIIMKTGTALERLAKARSIAFNKTGLLASGELAIDNITAFGDNTETELLSLAASLEQNSNHIVARSLIAEAKSKQIKLIKIKHVTEIADLGLQATLKTKTILIGNKRLMEQEKVKLPRNFKFNSPRQTATFIAIDGQLAGIITLKDEVRPEAADTLSQLHSLGLDNVLIITGDDRASVEFVATKLGVAEIHAEVTPSDKLRLLESAAKRPLAFVGNGIEDAPALTASDVGIAFDARDSTAARESADIVIMPDDLGRVATATYLAKRTFSTARQSVALGIGLSVLLMFIFATGRFSPVVGAVLQEVVDVMVILIALRAHTIRGSAT